MARSRDDILAEIRRLSRTPNITFEKGIMNTDDDSVLGYVQDLKNMEIDRGTVKRRRGSKFLCDQDGDIKKFVSTYSTNLFDINFVFGITGKRELWCWVEEFPEIDFKVMASTHDRNKEYLYSKDGTTQAGGLWLKFPEGDGFHFFEIGKYLFITTTTGLSIRINKRGYIRFAEGEDSLNDRDWSTHVSSVRNETATDPAVYFDIKEATNRELKSFYTIKDISDKSVPVSGILRTAYINDCDVVSKWSDPVVLPELESVYISRIPGISLDDSDGDGILGSQFVDFISDTASESDGYYITRSWDTSSSLSGTMSFDYTVSTASFTNSSVSTINMMFYSSDRLQRLIGWPLNASIDSTNANLGSFVKLKNIQFFPLGALDESQGNVFSGDIITEVVSYDAGRVSTDIVFVPNTATYTMAYNPLAATYRDGEFLTFNVIGTDIVNASKNPVGYNYNLLDSAGASVTSGFGRFFYADVDVQLITTAKCTFQKSSLKYSSDYFFNGGFPAKNIGNDNWDIYGPKTGTVSLQNSNIVNVDVNTKAIETNYTADVFLKNKGDGNNLSDVAYGIKEQRFVVLNNNKVVGVSQKAWGDPTDSSNAYIDYEGQVSSDDYASSAKQYQSVYSPICALDMQSIKPNYEVQFYDIMQNPQKIIATKSNVYILDGGELWISDESLLLKSRVEINFTIYNLEQFYDSIIIFTNKGIYSLDRKNKPYAISDGQNLIVKASTSSNSGSYVITESEEVYHIRIVVAGDGSAFPQAFKISDAVYSIEWGSTPIMQFVDDTLYIAREKDIYGFYQGGWKKRYEFDHKISNLAAMGDSLVVFFFDDLDYSRSDVY